MPERLLNTGFFKVLYKFIGEAERLLNERE